MSEKEAEFNYLQFLLVEMERRILSKEEYARLQFLLFKYENIYRWAYPLCVVPCDDWAFGLISDTHKGSRFEEDKLIDKAYELVIGKGIKTMIHLGDLTEALANDYNKPYALVEEELLRARERLPREITTKLLLGNHDYSAIRTYPKIIKRYFEDYPHLEILGMQRVLLDWGGDIVRLFHPISQLKHPKFYEQQRGVITISGHHHYYKLQEEIREIFLPTLSKEAFSYCPLDGSDGYYPFCVIASKSSGYLFFEIYGIDREIKSTISTEYIEVNTQTKELKLNKK